MVKGFQQVESTAARLKKAMDLRSKKQVDLAKETGIDKGSISHYVSGRYEPKQEAVNKLAIALGVSEMWLWGYDVPMEREKEISPGKFDLTEGEKIVLDLFRKVPVERQDMLIQMIRVALGQQE